MSEHVEMIHTLTQEKENVEVRFLFLSSFSNSYSIVLFVMDRKRKNVSKDSTLNYKAHI